VRYDPDDSDDQPVHIMALGDERMATVMQHRQQTASLEQNLNFGSDDDMMRGAEVEVEGVKGVAREKTVSESDVSTRDVEVQQMSES